ncbi:hypothetical protein COBT_001765, partial [Conglomerata obtusa]
MHRDQNNHESTHIDVNFEQNPKVISKPTRGSVNTTVMDINELNNSFKYVPKTFRSTKNYGFIDANVIDLGLSCNVDTNISTIDIEKNSANNLPMTDYNVYEYNNATKKLSGLEKKFNMSNATNNNIENTKKNSHIEMLKFYSEISMTIKAVAKHKLVEVETDINFKLVKMNVLNRAHFVICSDDNCFFSNFKEFGTCQNCQQLYLILVFLNFDIEKKCFALKPEFKAVLYFSKNLLKKLWFIHENLEIATVENNTKLYYLHFEQNNCVTLEGSDIYGY